MKNIQNLAYTVLITGAIFCFSSCSKNIDEQGISKNGDPSLLTALPSCPTPAPAFIGMQIVNGGGNKYFWYGNKGVVANRQVFEDLNFADKKFMEVSASADPGRPQTGKFSVLTPVPSHFGGRQRIGVKSVTGFENASPSSNRYTDLGDVIRPGESLDFKLGTDLSTKKMWKVRINLQGTAVADVEFWDDATKKGETSVNVTEAGGIVEFATTPANSFNTIKFKCESGNYGIKGFVESEFYLIESVGSFIGMSFNYLLWNRFIFRNSVGTALNDRQILQGGVGPVHFNDPTNNGNKWMNVSSTGGGLFYFLTPSSLGVSGFPNLNRLNQGESIIFEPGPDFGSPLMRMVEFTQSSWPGIIKAETFLNNVSQGVFQSNGGAGSTFLVGNRNNFDKVVISRVTAAPSIGVYGTSVRFYQACY